MSEPAEREIVVPRPVMPASSVLPINKLTRIPYDPRTLLGIMEPGNHIGIIGMNGSGKTTCWMWLLDYLKRVAGRERQKRGLKAEMMIVNEMGNWETLMLSQLHNIRLFVPEGADVEITPEPGLVLNNIKRIRFDPYNLRETLIAKLSPSKINIVAYEPFFDKPEEMCKFWGGDRSRGTKGFLPDLLDWQKQGYNDSPVAIFYDQINKIAPRYRSGMYSGQSILSNWISYNTGQFRIQGIRLVGTSWTLKELNANLVERFSYIIIKKVNQPEALDSYQNIFKSVKGMQPHQCCVINPERKWHPGLEIDQIIDPRAYRFKLHFEQVAKNEPNKKEQLLALLLKKLTERENGGLGLKQLEIAKLIGMPNSTVSDVFRDLGLEKSSSQDSAQVSEKISQVLSAASKEKED